MSGSGGWVAGLGLGQCGVMAGTGVGMQNQCSGAQGVSRLGGGMEVRFGETGEGQGGKAR